VEEVLLQAKSNMFTIGTMTLLKLKMGASVWLPKYLVWILVLKI
jgi:hypothetical protein